MIQAVEIGAGAPTNLAEVGRAALRADAVLLIDVSAIGRPRLLWASGLSAAEQPAVLDALSRRHPGAPVEIDGFAQAILRQASEPGFGTVALCGLQRRRAAFEGTDLALTIAQHGVLAARRRPAVRPQRSAGAAVDPYELFERAVDWQALDRAVTQHIRRLVPVQRTGILLWREERDALCPVPGAFGLGPDAALPGQDRSDWGNSAARVLATGEPYLTNRATSDSDYWGAFAVHRLIAVPIEASGRRVGVLQAVNKESAFTAEDVERLAEVAPTVASATEVVVLRERLRRSEQLEALFTSTAVAIASGLAAQEHLGAKLRELRLALDASVVALLAPGIEPIVSRAAGGRERLESGFLEQARTATGFRAFESPPRRAGEPGWAAAHVPVTVDGAFVATLSVLRIGDGWLEASDNQVLSRMAQLIALAWAAEGYQRGLADAARRAERRRIADELHDHVAQLLFAARLSLEAGPAASTASAAAGLPHAHDLLLRAEEATRTIMDRNAGSGDVHVSDLLAEVITEIEQEYGCAVGLEVTPAADVAADALRQSSRQLLARAAREAVVNAAKHAGPCQISVSLALTRRGRLLLTVIDTGVGVRRGRVDGYGTTALRRAISRQGGTLRVSSASVDGGTRVAVNLPV